MGLLWLGGADAWSGGGGAATELRGGVAALPSDRTWVSAASATEIVGNAGSALVLDQHGGEVGLSGRGSLASRVSASGWGSVGLGWVDGEVAFGVVARPMLRSRLSGTVGVGGRAAGSVAGPTGSARLGADHRVGMTTLSTRAAVTWLGGDLPPLVLGAQQWATAELGSVSGSVGLVITGVPAADALAVAGLPVPGSGVLQAVAAVDVDLVERAALHLEAAPEGGWGAAPYTRLRALVGIAVDLSRSLPEAHAPVDDRVRFEIVAPDADSAELLAEFNGWRAIPMARERGRWWVEVDAPPGAWEFSYRVDGELVVPPAADRYVPDGFGGTNAVVLVD